MAVTKQTYTATATWTAAGLATIFRSALIDAGYMTEWHDSFLSGSIENRVLEVTYDAAKTYGKTYYWFQFSTTGAFLHIATGWNTGSDIPAGPSGAGTQYLDWFATTTNSTTNHRTLLALVASTDAILTRYTFSGHTWFTLHQGATSKCFGIVPPAHTVRSWIDLNRLVFSGYFEVETAVSQSNGKVQWSDPLSLRRSHNGAHLRGATVSTDYGGGISGVYGSSQCYSAMGNTNNAFNNNGGYYRLAHPSVLLPVWFNNTNPAYSADSSPVFHSLPYCPYVESSLPTDFGVAFHFPQNTMSRGDKLIVSAGVEEWEILSRANNATINTGASPLFLARIV
jgi:hypothetical protein